MAPRVHTLAPPQNITRTRMFALHLYNVYVDYSLNKTYNAMFPIMLTIIITIQIMFLIHRANVQCAYNITQVLYMYTYYSIDNYINTQTRKNIRRVCLTEIMSDHYCLWISIFSFRQGVRTIQITV